MTDLLAFALGLTIIILSILTLAYFDKKRAERLQRISAIHYESLVEHNPNVVLTVDRDGMIISVNPVAMELLKFKQEEFQSKSMFSLFTEEERQQAEDKFFRLRDEDRKHLEASFQNSEGKWIPMFITFVPIIIDEEMIGAFVIARDNSEIVEYQEQIKKTQRDLINTMQILKSRKKRYKKILSIMSEGVFLYRADHQKVPLNENAYKMFGLEKEAFDEITILEKNIPFIDEQGNPLTVEKNPVAITLNTGNTIIGQVVGFRGKAKTTWLSVNTKLLEPLEFCGDAQVLVTMSDITSRKAMETGIIQAKEEAVRANLAKSEFLSHMSHELRTPLNAILGFSQLLEIKEPLSDQQRIFVQEILKAGRHLLELINEILDLSRIEAGTLKMTFDTIELGTIVEECINLVQSTAAKKGIQIKCDLGKCINLHVYVDPTRLKQIFLNLLENAIKYNKENGQISIVCEYGDNFLYLHFCDTGLGIPAEAQNNIFEPFFRLENPYVEGTGIGLSLVKRLIELMGGEVGVESQVGEGSNFWISLPVARSIQSTPSLSLRQQMVPLPQDKQVTILYIEDHQSNLQLVNEILGTYQSVTLLSAQTGLAGLRMTCEKKIDLILLDLHLPDLNGFEVLERLKANGATEGIPAIAVSANAMKDDIDRALLKGFSDYITKPIDVPAFLSIISKHLE